MFCFVLKRKALLGSSDFKLACLLEIIPTIYVYGLIRMPLDHTAIVDDLLALVDDNRYPEEHGIIEVSGGEKLLMDFEHKFTSISSIK